MMKFINFEFDEFKKEINLEWNNELKISKMKIRMKLVISIMNFIVLEWN